MGDPEVPPFELPEWGTAGAPPAPELDEAEMDGITIDESRAPSDRPAGPTAPTLTTLAPTTALRASDVIGLVTAQGDGEIAVEGLAGATASARSTALASLDRAARDLGAGAVVGVRLTAVSRRRQVVVIAYGTAVRTGG